ncbi:hypothetical protein D3C78_1738050 [compost metagenome]
MPRAIFCMALAMFSMRQPNEPSSFSCCWNSIIRLISVETPDVEPQVTRRPPRFSENIEPAQVSLPTCSNTTSTPFFFVSLRTTPSKRSVR